MLNTLFSRNRPSKEALAEMLNRDNKSAVAPAGQRVGGVRSPALKATVPQEPVILDTEDVPTGRYVSFESMGIPESFATAFALLFTGEKTAILLTAVESFSTHPQFELQRRLQVEHGVKEVTVRKASRMVIEIVHNANAAVKEIENTDVETAAHDVIEAALAKRASDIHIETRETHAEVFFRIHGERVEQPMMTKQTATEICNVLAAVHADADNKGVDWDPKKVQSAVIPYKSRAGTNVQLRFSSAPIYPSGNFHAVMRVIPMDAESGLSLEETYTDGQVQVIEEALLGSQGLVAVLGPTNSGKSASMRALIARIYERRGNAIKVITVEDPVEYVLPRACQSSAMAKDDGDEAFKALLKGTLRQDADVVMAGEIRDDESAENVKNLVLAGRKLATTMHVYEVIAAFTRLREIGVPPSVLFMEGFVSAFICQRLVPLLCEHCAIPIVDAVEDGRLSKSTFDRVARVADLHEDNICVRGDGCPECNYQGIAGRTLCAEVLVPDSTFLALMSQGRQIEARNHWMSNSPLLNIDGLGVTMIAHAIHKMRKGMVDPAHVETYIGKIVIDTPTIVPSTGTVIDFPAALQFGGN